MRTRSAFLEGYWDRVDSGFLGTSTTFLEETSSKDGKLCRPAAMIRLRDKVHQNHAAVGMVKTGMNVTHFLTSI